MAWYIELGSVCCSKTLSKSDKCLFTSCLMWQSPRGQVFCHGLTSKARFHLSMLSKSKYLFVFQSMECTFPTWSCRYHFMERWLCNKTMDAIGWKIKLNSRCLETGLHKLFKFLWVILFLFPFTYSIWTIWKFIE